MDERRRREEEEVPDKKNVGGDKSIAEATAMALCVSLSLFTVLWEFFFLLKDSEPQTIRISQSIRIQIDFHIH